jgi:excisionase family DNA binding protein
MKHLKELFLFLRENNNETLRDQIKEYCLYLVEHYGSISEGKYQMKNTLMDVKRIEDLGSYFYNVEFDLMKEEFYNKTREQQGIEGEKLLTVEEVADILHISKQSVYNMIRSDKLYTVQFDTIPTKSGRKTYRISSKEIKNLLNREVGHS